MEDNWEDVAKYLLRNRKIREMVDEVLNLLDEIDPNCQFRTDESPKQKNQNNHKRKITKPNVIQKERFLKEYRMTKYITEEKKKELAGELNLSQMTIKNWFQNRRRREALLQRNKTATKVRRTNVCKRNNDAPSEVSINVNIKIPEVLKPETIQLNYQNNLSGFLVTQDENGICLLHEL